MQAVSDSAELFRHVSAEKSEFYRCIMDVFAAAKRQYRLQLRPDEVLGEARWPGEPPRIEDVNTALAQLAAWGNLESHPDTARVSSLSDFYRARFLYRLPQGGEAVEAALWPAPDQVIALKAHALASCYSVVRCGWDAHHGQPRESIMCPLQLRHASSALAVAVLLFAVALSNPSRRLASGRRRAG
jgi:hypothetical protein